MIIFFVIQEAIKQALTHGDRMVQAKCLLNFAEIHRERMDFQVNFDDHLSLPRVAILVS